MRESASPLWLKSRRFDLLYFHVSGLASLLLLIPILAFGQAGQTLIYLGWLVLLSYPHNYFTWASVLPASARRTFRMRSLVLAGGVCLVASVLLSLSLGTPLFDGCMSFALFYVSAWHTYRQHVGICRVYDLVQSRRTGDASILSDRKPMHLFFTLAMGALLLCIFMRSGPKYLVPDQSARLVHPPISPGWMIAYGGLTAAVGVWGVKRCLLDRWRAGKLIPWPQLSLMAIAMATFSVGLFDVTRAYILVVVASVYHNVQYFGFVWHFEKYRTREMVEAGWPLQLPQALVHRGQYKSYFAMALVYAALFMGAVLLVSPAAGLALASFGALSHIAIDSLIWRRDHNLMMGNVTESWAAPSRPGTLPARADAL